MNGMTGILNPNSKKYIIVTDNNDVILVTGLRNFCIKNNLNSSGMVQVAKGMHKHHKKYLCFYFSEEKYQELLNTYNQEEKLKDAA
jgi:hypothetical protein